MKKPLKRSILAGWVIIVATIIITTLLPTTHPPTKYHFDKVLHFGAYATMAGLPALVLAKRYMRGVAALLVCIGIGTEIGQLLVPGRSGTLGDAVANLSGVAVGAMAGLWVKRLVIGYVRKSKGKKS